MEYIIFGCGDIGRTALECLGADNVSCFADNYHSGETVCGKRVVSFPEMVEICGTGEGTAVAVASDNYWEEMTAQVREAGIARYAVFREYTWPSYRKDRRRVCVSAGALAEKFGLPGCSRIGIYGETLLTARLAEEIRRRAPGTELFLISQDPPASASISIPLPRMSLAEADGRIDCLCIAVPRCEDSAALRDRRDLPGCRVVDLYGVDPYEPAFQYAGLEACRNLHAGRRIFLVGNGPSLRIEDLNTLHEHGELCMAFNKAYRAYDRTPWRADYYGFSDAQAVNDCAADIPGLPGTVFMADTFHFFDNPHFKNARYFHMITEKFYPNYPGFSGDPSRGMYNGNTVVYDIGLQLAAYMGAGEIYLLGVDHTLSGDLAKPGNHFISDYIRPEELEQYRGVSVTTDRSTRAFQKAELYSRAHGFRIFNATRGGKLEAFERVDFDSLF